LLLRLKQNITIHLIFLVSIMISRLDILQAEERLNPDRELSIIIVIADQKLYLLENNIVVKQYDISSSKYGIGNKSGSNKTPLGIHKVAKKFGKKAKANTIFKSRRNIGRIAEINYDPRKSSGDFVTSRILWLSGLEEGVNKGNGIDSYLRHIYIHGTPDEGLIGIPASHGCIRMKNKDVIELFDLVPLDTIVDIKPE